MSKKAFDKIAEGLNEALAIARREGKLYKLHVRWPVELDLPDNFARKGTEFDAARKREDWNGGPDQPPGRKPKEDRPRIGAVRRDKGIQG